LLSNSKHFWWVSEIKDVRNKDETKWDWTFIKKLKKFWKSWGEIKEQSCSDWKIDLIELRKLKYLIDIEKKFFNFGRKI
jgi:hypothetical protein